jgi:hypothetical protein
MKKFLTITLTVVLVVISGCKKDNHNVQSSLSASPTSISAAATAGNYPITVTANTAWTAAVDAAASWCILANSNTNGNGTVTVNVSANIATATRAATVTITAGTLTRAVTINQAAIPPPPPYAASAQMWTFGSSTLTWSDAIRIPACNKESFTNDYDNPQCRSYTSGTNTWYYYNWPYVNQNASMLCSSPWRVPTQSDFTTLASVTNYSNLISEWGYGGYALGSSVSSTSSAYYWSSTEYDNSLAYYLYYTNSNLGVNYNYKFNGFQVRCVK